MDEKIHTVTITIYDRNAAYQQVSELLHQFADHILLRVGYPFSEKNVAIIFIILRLDLAALGALTGKLGQITSVKVKATTLKV
jgi:putative iron-only hydrogenase system regulator